MGMRKVSAWKEVSIKLLWHACVIRLTDMVELWLKSLFSEIVQNKRKNHAQ